MNQQYKTNLLATVLIGTATIQTHAANELNTNTPNTTQARESIMDVSLSYYMDQTDSFDKQYDLEQKSIHLGINYWDKNYDNIPSPSLKQAYLSLSGIELSSHQLDLESHPDLNEDEDYYLLRSSLNFGYRASTNWRIDGYLGIAFNIADGLDNTHIRGELEAGALMRYAPDGSFDNGFVYHIGAEQSYDFDGLVPTLAVAYKQENYTALVGLPETSFHYQFTDKFSLKLEAKLQGKRGFFYNETTNNEEVEFQSTAIHSQLLAQYQANESLAFQVGVGYLFSREVDIESDSIQINDSSSDGWTLFGGLTYKW